MKISATSLSMVIEDVTHSQLPILVTKLNTVGMEFVLYKDSVECFPNCPYDAEKIEEIVKSFQ